MSRDEEEVSRSRLVFLNAFILLAALIIGSRLFREQIVDGAKYKAKAEKQHITKQEVRAQRGSIYINEEYGEPYPVATNIVYYQVSVVPKFLKNPREVAEELSSFIQIDANEIYRKINNKRLYLPPLKKHLTKQTAEKIEELDLTGVYLAPEVSRLYPEGSMLAQTLGFIDNQGNGNYGVEAFYHEAMEGISGVKVANRDSTGRKISTIKTEVEVQNGLDVILNIEHNAQFKAEQIISKAVQDYQADGGSLVVMDVKNGGIVAMANTPGYDPNNFPQVAKDNPEVFRNPSVSAVWEPGSIMKPLVVGAALDQNLITPDTTGDYAACVTVQNYPICTAEKKAFGHETMTQVLENSDNVAMVDIGNKLGNDVLFSYMKRFGFGEKTRIDLQGEATGYLIDGKKWKGLSRSTITFGQGISTTPVQMVAAYAAVANKGVLLKPFIAKELRKSDGSLVKIEKEEVGRVFSEKAAADLTQMLISVCEKGTGRKARVSGYWVAGKTGTAQIPKPGGGYYEDRHVGSFAGFFPADNPRFAMVVKVDNPKNTQWAESSAAPTFGQMAQWLLTYYRIPANR